MTVAYLFHPIQHLSWALLLDDATGRWSLEPRGRSSLGATMFALLLSIPIITATLAVAVFRWSFYGIKYNKYGAKPKESRSHYFPIITGNKDKEGGSSTGEKFFSFGHSKNVEIIGWPEDPNKRRKVLIATLEYEILDWKLKVK
jgi:alpha-1,3-glucan synthase